MRIGIRRRVPTRYTRPARPRPGFARAPRLRAVFLVGALVASLSVCLPGVSSAAATGNPGVTRTGQVLTGISTDKSRYAPGDTVSVTVELTNATGSDISGGNVALYAMSQQTAADAPASQALNLGNGASSTLTFTWTAPQADFTGYMLSAVATDGSGTAVDSINVAVDVSSSWTRFPRYGYMTNNTFGNQSLSTSQAASIMSTMSKYHIDGLQFYDWQYNHDQPLCGTVSAPCASWTDDGNQRTVYASAVKNLINAAHGNHIVAMPYNAIFSADNGSCCGAPDYKNQGLGISPTWGVYTDTGHSKPLAFFQWDYMDPSNPSWQQFIMNQENAAIQAFGFDGFHGDTFGDPDTVDYTYNGQPAGVATNPCTTDTESANSSTPVHNVAGSTTWLSGTFPSFLTYAKSVLGSKYLMFNPVTYDHAHCEANTSPVDLLYSELWPNDRDQYWDYNTLKQAIDQGFSESASADPAGRGKSLAVAAYVDFANGGGGTFNTPDVLLMDSTLFASGGSHEELGDTGLMLDYQEYRAGATPMSAALSQSVQKYYDFMTAYENLLRDGQTNTNQTVSIQGQTVSNQAKPGNVWAFTKSDSDHEIIQLINMVGQSSTLWQTGNCDMCSHVTSPHPAPTQLTNIPVKYYYQHQPKAVLFASPDYNGGTTYQLPFTTGTDSGGSYVSFTAPSLNYWDMIYTSQTGPGDAPKLPGTGTGTGTPPSAPGTPAATNVTATSATLSWTAASPGTNPVAGYDVYRVGSPDTLVASVSGLSTTITGLTPGTTYQFYVKARDTAGLTGPPSGNASVTTTAQPPGNSAKVTYNILSDWGTGFNASITITNTGTTPINGWTLGFTFPGNQKITDGWNATWSQDGQNATAKSQSFNATINPGGSFQIGFNGSYTGTNSKPTTFTLNGQTATTG